MKNMKYKSLIFFLFLLIAFSAAPAEETRKGSEEDL